MGEALCLHMKFGSKPCRFQITGHVSIRFTSWGPSAMAALKQEPGDITMETHKVHLHSNELQASLAHYFHDIGNTLWTQTTSLFAIARWQQWQQLQLLLLFTLYSSSMIYSANASATSLGTSLSFNGLNGSTTLRWNETLVSSGGQFTLGFYQNENIAFDGVPNYTLAIWYTKVTVDNIVWMMNVSTVLSSNATLSLSKDGNLQVRDANFGLSNASNVPLWNSNTQNMNITMATILNTGNLVLLNTTKHVVWKSFDYPTNTLLPNQHFMSSNKIKMFSWKNKKDHNKGRYSMSWNDANQLQVLYESSLYANWTINYWNYWTTSLEVVLTSTGTFQALLAPNVSDVFAKNDLNIPIKYFRITLADDGNLRIYGWESENSTSWTVVWEAITGYCMIYGYCGPFSLCEDGQCQCAKGFQYINMADKRQGCSRIKNASFCNTNKDKDVLQPVSGDFPYGSDFAHYVQVSLEYCKKQCLDTCHCQSATVSNPYTNGNLECWLKTNDLINGRYQTDRTSYLRMPANSISKSNVLKIPYSASLIITFISAPLTIVFGFILCIFSPPILLRRVQQFKLKKLERRWKASHGTIVKFTYDEICLITKDFSQKIGKGGYGTVYKGEIGCDDAKIVIAVKKLENVDRGTKEFVNEVDVIGKIHHIHLIHLLGYCANAHHKILVYEYMEKRSLDISLFRAKKSKIPILEWRSRFNIAIQIARGLAYLHDGIREQRIIHCDVKPENILIDSTYLAKVADFGLSRILDREKSRTMTENIRGTWGYLAPEWTSKSTPVTPKIDVYSFGMVLLEIVSGHRNSNSSSTTSNKKFSNEMPSAQSPSNELTSEELTESMTNDTNWYFPLWAFSKLDEPNFDVFDVLDPSLSGIAQREEVERVLKVAFWCINTNHQLRPSMSKVVEMLEGHVPIGLPLPQPKFNGRSITNSNAPFIMETNGLEV